MPREAIAQMAAELGFQAMGVVAPELCLRLDEESQQAGSILVFAMPYALYSWEEDQAQVAGYYFVSNKSYHAARDLSEKLSQSGSRAWMPKDIHLKHAASLGGLGHVRNNTILYTPEWGSFVALQALAVDWDLPRDQPLPPDPCGSCTACAKACPSQALDGKGGFQRQRCLRFHMNMMSGNPIPEEYRRDMGKALLGCEICQAVCPKEPRMQRQRFPQAEVFSIEKLLESSRETLDTIAALMGKNQAHKGRIQAMAALAAGNSGDPRYVPALTGCLGSDFLPAQEHAQWAITQLKEDAADD